MHRGGCRQYKSWVPTVSYLFRAKEVAGGEVKVVGGLAQMWGHEGFANQLLCRQWCSAKQFCT